MLKKILLLLVTLAPLNSIRIALLRLIFNYDISFDSQIGMFNLIECGICKIKGGRIGRFNQIKCNEFDMEAGCEIRTFNRFINLNKIKLCADSIIVSRNSFVGTNPGICPYKGHENISIGSKCIITRKHSFDVSDEITIGSDVTFAGFGIQVWTHGFDINHIKIQGPVTIGNQCYIGASSILSLGVSIADNVLVGAGTIVPKSINESGFYVSSQLIRKSDVQSFQNHKDLVEYNGSKFLRK